MIHLKSKVFYNLIIVFIILINISPFDLLTFLRKQRKIISFTFGILNNTVTNNNNMRMA